MLSIANNETTENHLITFNSSILYIQIKMNLMNKSMFFDRKKKMSVHLKIDYIAVHERDNK